jgi:beta-glucosidase
MDIVRKYVSVTDDTKETDVALVIVSSPDGGPGYRSYKGKTVAAVNTTDLDLIRETRKAMKGKPAVVSIAMSKPVVFADFETGVNAILVTFGVQDQAILAILTGAREPAGFLPMQMPAHMRTVEEQYGDVPHDMECHVDSVGNTYDFGLSWSGAIDDARTAEYRN